jgi:hypothetical protein
MRKAVATLAAVAIAVAGVIGLIAFFNSRDNSTTSDQGVVSAPGVEEPAGGGVLLERGNVVLTFSDPTFAPKLRSLAADLGAPDTPELRAVGQAVVVRRDPQAGGVVARAQRHSLTVVSPADPRLQDFIEHWLGQGSSG